MGQQMKASPNSKASPAAMPHETVPLGYLPRHLNDGSLVLVEGESDGTWKAQKPLGLDAPGVGYRNSRDFHDRMNASWYLSWGSVVDGFEEGEWVRCKVPKAHMHDHAYLPKYLKDG